MNNHKQATLFQSWANKPSSQAPQRPKPELQQDQADCFGDDADDDALLAMAMAESLKEANVEDTNENEAGPSSHAPPTSKGCATNGTEQSGSRKLDPILETYGIAEDDFDEDNDIAEEQDLSNIQNLPGFDLAAGRLWIYPTNYPLREYQYNITQQALFKNTMVTLPTGLGKTFIAAVVMYNFYRWYPQGKIVFMAPTKPLVAQQIEACYNIMGIPQSDTSEMTGAMQPAERVEAWRKKRVFFLTPQVLSNDLNRQTCPSELIKCLVIDEAHKSKGNHAYCLVVRELIKYNKQFRVLALSATPGNDLKAVQEVISNLLIAHIELRQEDSIDIRPYSHERKVDKIVVKLGPELEEVIGKYMMITSVTVNKLKRQKVLFAKDPKSLSKFMILKSREGFRQNPPGGLSKYQFGAVEGDFALLMTLYHGYELVQQHGLRSLFNFLQNTVSGEKGTGKTKAELTRNPIFIELMNYLSSKFQPTKSFDPNKTQLTPTASQKQKPAVVGHPKMAKLEEIALAHFKKFLGDDGISKTRVMIFSQYRDSVNEITELLSRHRPLIKAMCFIGQTSTGKSTRGFTQKDQLKVMKQFREGGYNTLVATCVGEEGLDIGDVDLIICFDAHKSPIRLVQRMGRTGRKREGRIVMLVTQGKEENTYNTSQFTKNKINKAILGGKKSLLYYPENPPMIPDGLQPACHKMHIAVTKVFQAQTRGRSAPSAAPSTSVTSVPKKGGKTKEKNDGFLTEAELRYWNDNYKVPLSDTFRLPETTMVYFEKKSAHSAPSRPPHGRELTLSDWMLWQNQLDHTRVSGHSSRSRDLVQIIEFMDIQSSVGSSEDCYGQEMRTYLNKDDVITTPARGAGIRRFCTPTGPGASAQAKAGKRKSDEAPAAARSKRPKRVLPEFPPEEPITVSDDDEDLPSAFAPVDIDESSRDSVVSAASVTFGKRSKKKLFNPRDSCLLGEFAEPADTTEMGERQKSGSFKRRITVLEDVDVCDAGDFQGETEQSRLVVANTDVRIVVSDVTGERHERTAVSPTGSDTAAFAGESPSAGTEAPMDADPLPDDLKPDCIPVTYSDDGLGKEDSPERSNSPVFPTQCRHGTQKKLSAGSTYRRVEARRLGRVRTPPSVEDAAADMAALDRKEIPSPVDVLELIDLWNKDMDEGVFENCKRTLHVDKPDAPVASPGEKQLGAEDRSVMVDFTRDYETEPRDRTPMSPGELQSVLYPGVVDIPAGGTASTMVTPRAKVTSPSPGVTPDSAHRTSACPLPDDSEIPFLVPDTEWDPLTEADEPMETELPGSSESDSPLGKPFEHYLDEDAPGVSMDASGVFEVAEDKGMTVTETAIKPGLSHVMADDEDSPVFLTPVSTKPNVGTITSTATKWSAKSSVFKTPTSNMRNRTTDEHDSFFSTDAADDSLFAALDTPVVADKVGRTPGRSCDVAESQITFTQALNCVNESLESTCSFSPSPPRPDTRGSCPATGEPPPESSTHLQSHGGRITTDTGSDNKVVDAAPSTVTPPAGSKPPAQTPLLFEEPQFDLGVDLDEFDDEIVPPSPPTTQPFSERSQAGVPCADPRDTTLPFGRDREDSVLLSQTILIGGLLGGRRRGSSPETSPDAATFTAIKDKTALAKHTRDQTDDSHVKSGDHQGAGHEEEESQSILAPPTEKIPRGEDRGPVISRAPQQAPADEEEESQSLLSPVPSRTLPHTRASAPQDQDELRLSQDKPVARVIPTHVGEGESRGTSPAKGSDDEDSFIRAPRRKRPLILSSPDTPDRKKGDVPGDTFKTPLRPAPKCKQKNAMRTPELLTSPDDESPLVRVTKRNTRRVLEDDDDDFVDNKRRVPPQRSRSSCMSKAESKNYAVSTNPQTKATGRTGTNKPQKRPGNQFIEGEAELSGEGSTDDSEEDLDQFDASFVNDATQLTQEPDTEDMRAIYMRSVRSPLQSGSYKLRYPSGPPGAEVFSQVPDPMEHSEYQEDSFCVGDDFHETEYPEFDSESEITMLQPSKRRNAGLKDKASRPKGRSRILRVHDSSSDEECAAHGGGRTPCRSPETAATHRPRRAVVLSSDTSETDSNRDKDSPEFTHVISRKREPSRAPALPEVDSPTGYTQMPSLKSRLEQRVDGGVSAGNNVTRNPPSAACSTSHAASSIPAYTPAVEQPMFSLGIDDLLDDLDQNDDPLDVPPHTSNISTSSSVALSVSCVSEAPANCSAWPARPSNVTMTREERLLISRQKQEECRRKLLQAQRAIGQSANDGDRGGAGLGDAADTSNTSHGAMDKSLLTPMSNESAGEGSNKPVILVDSKEINAAQDLVSALRFRHGMHTAVRSLGSCDYVISNRMAVERKLVDDIANGANKKKLLARTRAMCDQYDRPVIIIEKERVKPNEKDCHKPLLRSKYVDNMLACLTQSHIKVVYSDNQECTAALLAQLSGIEAGKNMSIRCPIDISPSRELLMQFLQCIPHVGYVTALNLLHGYRSFADLVASPAVVIEKRGKISKVKSEVIIKFINHRYDRQMTSISNQKR